MDKDQLKEEVATYWNQQSCGTDAAASEKFSKEYFEEIEAYRYRVEPEIFSFAQFTRYHGKKVLEVGIGAGTDFLQWVRAGAEAYGVDLTQESIDHVKHRLDIYGLQAENFRVADAEHLPYQDNYFDLVYSFGVIHHTPDTIKALEELIRCAKPGGTIKFMVYNRHSLNAFYQYLRFGLFSGKPFRSLGDVIYHHMESLGTKSYTIKEIRSILAQYPVEIQNIQANVTSYDLLWKKSHFLRFLAYTAACLLGNKKCGWFLTVELKKAG